jgi:hypothetical protein
MILADEMIDSFYPDTVHFKPEPIQTVPSQDLR